MSTDSSQLRRFGWSEQIENLFAPFAAAGLDPARVVRVDRGFLMVAGSHGDERAVVAGILASTGEPEPAVVGDWAAVERTDGTVMVRAIVPRSSALARRRPGAAERQQVVAANVTTVLVVEGCDRGPNPRRIERAAALAWGCGADPVVVLTKMDLCCDPDAAVEVATAAHPFGRVVVVAAGEGGGIAELEALLAGSSAVLLGPSGVGKSTLVNRLLGEDRLAIGAVRDGDHKGRHTTTWRQLVVTPGGACLIDTPGVRELGVWLDDEAVRTAFADIDELGEGCRFRDCSHQGEPGCAVLAAVEAGTLEASRLGSYHKLRREAELHAERSDPARRHEVRERGRRFARMARAELERKRRG